MREEKSRVQVREKFVFTEKRELFSDLNVRDAYFAKRPPITQIINKSIPPPWCHLAKSRIKLILALHLTSPCTPNTSTNSKIIKNLIYKYLVFI